jgi:NADPH:quinone reductase-like Zn-dependent oxidoreductase
MKAIMFREYGGPEVLDIATHPDPEPARGMVVIAVRAFGLNRAETYMRSGKWGDVAKVSGIECVGEVLDDPSNRFAKGTRVAALMGGMGRSIDGSSPRHGDRNDSPPCATSEPTTSCWTIPP